MSGTCHLHFKFQKPAKSGVQLVLRVSQELTTMSRSRDIAGIVDLFLCCSCTRTVPLLDSDLNSKHLIWLEHFTAYLSLLCMTLILKIQRREHFHHIKSSLLDSFVEEPS